MSGTIPSGGFKTIAAVKRNWARRRQGGVLVDKHEKCFYATAYA